MELHEFLNRVINDGVRELTKHYPEDGNKKRLGGIAGFEACRDKDLEELTALLTIVGKLAITKRGTDEYWYYRFYDIEVEWVCECISAYQILRSQKPIIVPAARAYRNAIRILKS